MTKQEVIVCVIFAAIPVLAYTTYPYEHSMEWYMTNIALWSVCMGFAALFIAMRREAERE